jgi:hypothetical protein
MRGWILEEVEFMPTSEDDLLAWNWRWVSGVIDVVVLFNDASETVEEVCVDG